MKRRDEVTVGILITVAVVVLVLGTLWLARGGLRSGYPLYTRFAWGQNLKQGQPVLLAGVNVGYVGDVSLRRDGYLNVMLRIDDQYSVPKGSNAVVKPIGIFGDVAIALNPPTPLPTQSYAAGDTVPPGPPVPDINVIMSRVDTIGTTLQTLMTSMKAEVIDAGTVKELRKTFISAQSLSAQAQLALVEQNKNVTLTLAEFRAAIGRLQSAVDSQQVVAAEANLRVATENLARTSVTLDSTTRQVRQIVTGIQGGQGSLGKLLTDTSLYGDLRHLAQAGDSLLADLKKNPKKYFNLHIF
jgi:phospholipid/cholesterol/gamma-HCH transport system substrate-binding protein